MMQGYAGPVCASNVGTDHHFVSVVWELHPSSVLRPAFFCHSRACWVNVGAPTPTPNCTGVRKLSKW